MRRIHRSVYLQRALYEYETELEEKQPASCRDKFPSRRALSSDVVRRPQPAPARGRLTRLLPGALLLTGMALLALSTFLLG